jgi:hypothetical protein
MGQPVQVWTDGKTRDGERVWLSTLVDAMERLSRPELRAKPCDGVALEKLRAQLALPASIRFVSPFSLRN